jgi:hypothetical protein
MRVPFSNANEPETRTGATVVDGVVVVVGAVVVGAGAVVVVSATCDAMIRVVLHAPVGPPIGAGMCCPDTVSGFSGS